MTQLTAHRLPVTYRKTKSGEWVAFGPVDRITAGGEVTVTKKSGETKTHRVARVGKPFTVNGRRMVYGYLAERASGGARSRGGCTCGLHRSYRQCRTDGNCSSFGDSRNCGGCDCDGF